MELYTLCRRSRFAGCGVRAFQLLSLKEYSPSSALAATKIIFVCSQTASPPDVRNGCAEKKILLRKQEVVGLLKQSWCEGRSGANLSSCLTQRNLQN
jgi:hypothetical protein